jgi:hypothetical protein
MFSDAAFSVDVPSRKTLLLDKRWMQPVNSMPRLQAAPQGHISLA